MITRAFLLAAVAVFLTACGTTPTVQAPPPEPYPSAPERLLDKAQCPDADPDGEGLLHDPADGSADAVLESRKRDGRMYLRCREAYHGLIDHERGRMKYQREQMDQ